MPTEEECAECPHAEECGDKCFGEDEMTPLEHTIKDALDSGVDTYAITNKGRYHVDSYKYDEDRGHLHLKTSYGSVGWYSVHTEIIVMFPFKVFEIRAIMDQKHKDTIKAFEIFLDNVM